MSVKLEIHQISNPQVRIFLIQDQSATLTREYAFETYEEALREGAMVAAHLIRNPKISRIVMKPFQGCDAIAITLKKDCKWGDSTGKTGAGVNGHSFPSNTYESIIERTLTRVINNTPLIAPQIKGELSLFVLRDHLARNLPQSVISHNKEKAPQALTIPDNGWNFAKGKLTVSMGEACGTKFSPDGTKSTDKCSPTAQRVTKDRVESSMRGTFPAIREIKFIIGS